MRRWREFFAGHGLITTSHIRLNWDSYVVQISDRSIAPRRYCCLLPEFPTTTILPSDWITKSEIDAVFTPKAVVAMPPEPKEVSSGPVLI
jgi:hypothetical protein